MSLLRHYRIDLLRPGSFVDESGRAVQFSAAVVERAAAEINRAIADGVTIPVVRGDSHPTDLHESTPAIADHAAYCGQLDLAAVQGGWLRADVAVGDRELPTTRASVWIEPRHEVGGKTYSPFVRHVLLTDDPAVRDLAPLALLRAPDGGRVLTNDDWSDRSDPSDRTEPPHRQERHMDGAQLREKLGLAADATDDAVLAAIDELLARPAKPSPDDQTGAKLRGKLALAADATDDDTWSALDRAIAAAKPKQPEPEIPADLSARLQTTEARIREMDRDIFSRRLGELVAEGRITPAVRDKVLGYFPSAYGARLKSGATEQRGDESLLAILAELPPIRLTEGRLRVVPGLPAGDERKVDSAAEVKRTLQAAGLATT